VQDPAAGLERSVEGASGTAAGRIGEYRERAADEHHALRRLRLLLETREAGLVARGRVPDGGGEAAGAGADDGAAQPADPSVSPATSGSASQRKYEPQAEREDHAPPEAGESTSEQTSAPVHGRTAEQVQRARGRERGVVARRGADEREGAGRGVRDQRLPPVPRAAIARHGRPDPLQRRQCRSRLARVKQPPALPVPRAKRERDTRCGTDHAIQLLSPLCRPRARLRADRDPRTAATYIETFIPARARSASLSRRRSRFSAHSRRSAEERSICGSHSTSESGARPRV